ncbi:hypothetical protein J7J12_03390 [bacterium]|nr:hypothetical protein [bacterium]
MKKLPKSFKYLLWSYNFSKIDAQRDKQRIIINTINYGNWEHWKWIIKNYGKETIKRIIENTPKSEFRERALMLICLLLKIKKVKYVSRSAKIKAKRDIF